VIAVLRHAHAVRDLGKPPFQEAGLPHDLEPDRRSIRGEHLLQLDPHPLQRHGFELHTALGLRHHRHRALELGIESRRQGGGEARRTQRAQRILAKPLERIPDRTQPPPLEVERTLMRIEELARRRIESHGVDREVPAIEILEWIARELHLVRMARVRIRPLAAKRGALHLEIVFDHEDGAVAKSDGIDATETRAHLLRVEIGGHVERRVALAPEQHIPHRSTHEHGAVVAFPQAGQHASSGSGHA
jgi:hypothetical protein